MAERSNPTLCVIEEVSLTGTMAVYALQAEASLRIPQQWQELRSAHPSLDGSAKHYGASPCSTDHKIHYLTGVELQVETLGGSGDTDIPRLLKHSPTYVGKVTHVGKIWAVD